MGGSFCFMKGPPIRQLVFIDFVASFLSKSWSFALACWHGWRLPGFIFRGVRWHRQSVFARRRSFYFKLTVQRGGNFPRRKLSSIVSNFARRRIERFLLAMGPVPPDSTLRLANGINEKFNARPRWSGWKKSQVGRAED